jgi:hypothetical protein
MDVQLALLCALTFIINLIGGLAYAVRIAGVRTRRIAMSFALFNVLVLVSRASNTFQGQSLSKRIENSLIETGGGAHLLSDFRWLLVSASLAALIGTLAIPTFQRLFTGAVAHFQINRSIPKLLLHAFAKGGISYIRDAATLPSPEHVRSLARPVGIPVRVIALNVAAQALLTVGVFASLYAGYLDPQYRVTSVNLSSAINGVATILLFVFIDPHLSIMTDDVMDGRTTEASFRRAVVWFAASRVAGTLLAQILLVPAAGAVAHLARIWPG